MSPETLAHIRADVQTAMVENRHSDPALLPDLLDYLLTKLSEAAAAPSVAGYCPACSGDELVMDWAGAMLEQVQLRAISQIPFAADTLHADDPYWSDHL